MIRAWVVAVALAAAGCATPAQTQRDLDQVARQGEQQAMTSGLTQEGQGEDTCGMAQFRYLVGKPAADVDHAQLPLHTRVIRPGMMVTQDYAPGRLNIRIAPDGKVASLGCF